MDVRDCVVVVTGAVGGIGLGIVRAFLEKGSKVCLIDVQDDRGIEIEKSLAAQFGERRVLYVNCDVSKREQIELAFDRANTMLGPVRVVCNNAGLHDDVKNPGHMVDVNLTGVIHGTLAGLERMRVDKGGPGGVIINTASFAGLWPYWVFPAYSATKAGVISFTRAYSLHPKQVEMGVRFITLCPSTVRCERQNNMDGKVLDFPGLLALNESEGFLEVNEVAALVCLLAEKEPNGRVAAISKNDGVVFHDLPTKILF